MKTKYKILGCLIIGFFSIVMSCTNKESKDIALSTAKTENKTTSTTKAFQPNKDFNAYWYTGEAEISSYNLEQSRYGETRNGTAVLIYVTEPFLEKKQVKADNNNASNISVLKLNRTKNFTTGIYPYSIMQSTFYPIANNQHAIKVSCSIQEWCGHVYTQLNNREQFEIDSHSYFENQADSNFNLDKNVLENELWTQLRIDPKSLPTGTVKIIPSLEFIRLKHDPLKAYEVSATLNTGSYILNYLSLKRKLTINFNPEFPYEILNWEENINGAITKATRLKTIKSAYWNKKSKKDEALRETLLLQ
ncbi:septum formation inhibitor Maf [Lacinutrix sp. Bg11-31]|uniref:septum formation inhibitor Maf n=1 Tax=Lacinutrix sp. Bg11-31 TaxID=2057808 RepID=UPI000C312B4A|nr:septum formation inhibitor Maf [Lacinutrix sp. Bg11-31]AUC81080.1 septum formation inhibitor Maf [Lacinutrix sp. Bg11-31]